jgi:SAM-dependent methyltransferase
MTDRPGPVPPSSSPVPGPRSFWDLSYEDGSYLDHWDPPRVPAELAAAVADGLLPLPGPVLDVGCGGGVESVFLAEQGYAVIGVDASPQALEIGRRRADTARVAVDWRHGSVFALPLADGEATAAVDRGCFHALDPEDHPLYVAELARVLAAGAPLLLRGSAETDEEEGLVGVDAATVDRFFPTDLFHRGPLVPCPLHARAGTLEGHLVVLRRRG